MGTRADLWLWLVLLAFLAIVAVGIRARFRPLEGDLFAISAPTPKQISPALFQVLHGLLRPPWRRYVFGQPHVSLEFAAADGEFRAQVWIPRGERALVEGALRAAYPGVSLALVAEPPVSSARRAAGVARLGRRRSDLPLKTAFEGEPLSGVLYTFARVPEGANLRLQVLVRPKPDGWQDRARRRAQALRDRQRLAGTGLFATTRVLGPSRRDREEATAIERKADELGFDVALRVTATAPRGTDARELVRSIAAGLRTLRAENALSLRNAIFPNRIHREAQRRAFPTGRSLLLTAPELDGLWHLPTAAPPQYQAVQVPRVAAPAGAAGGERILGVASWADGRRPVGLSIADSRSHLHLLGSTGTGKTTAMLSLALQDIVAGRGVAVLDPKGDLVRGLLERIPRERVPDVVLITPDDTERSVGLNPLELGPGDDRDLVAENALSTFKRIYERYWGPRTDDILKSALLTLLRTPGTTLAHVPLLLSDATFRKRIVAAFDDPLGLEGFWQSFEQLSESQRNEAIGPVLNKLRDLLVRPKLRRLLCVPRSTVNISEVVESGKILLADLSVGRWGEAPSALIGSFLVARIWQAVLARSGRPESSRPDFFLFVDEFQHFVGIAGPFADVLAEARSLHLSLCIANQHLGQLTRDLRDAVDSNARSRLVFQCGQEDAAYLARQFVPLDAQALMSLDRFEAAARLSVGGRTSPAFTLRTRPLPLASDGEVAAAVQTSSARRFGRPVDEIDQALTTALDSAPVSPAEVSRPRPRSA